MTRPASEYGIQRIIKVVEEIDGDIKKQVELGKIPPLRDNQPFDLQLLDEESEKFVLESLSRLTTAVKESEGDKMGNIFPKLREFVIEQETVRNNILSGENGSAIHPITSNLIVEAIENQFHKEFEKSQNPELFTTKLPLMVIGSNLDVLKKQLDSGECLSEENLNRGAVTALSELELIALGNMWEQLKIEPQNLTLDSLHYGLGELCKNSRGFDNENKFQKIFLKLEEVLDLHKNQPKQQKEEEEKKNESHTLTDEILSKRQQFEQNHPNPTEQEEQKFNRSITGLDKREINPFSDRFLVEKNLWEQKKQLNQERKQFGEDAEFSEKNENAKEILESAAKSLGVNTSRNQRSSR